MTDSSSSAGLLNASATGEAKATFRRRDLWSSGETERIVGVLGPALDRDDLLLNDGVSGRVSLSRDGDDLPYALS